jgi:hypothetical protein
MPELKENPGSPEKRRVSAEKPSTKPGVESEKN